MFKFQLNINETFINKSTDVLVENKLDGQDKFFGRNKYMNSVIFDGEDSYIGKNINVKISKLAQGLPVGGEIETSDDGTLISAFKNRRDL